MYDSRFNAKEYMENQLPSNKPNIIQNLQNNTTLPNKFCVRKCGYLS